MSLLCNSSCSHHSFFCFCLFNCFLQILLGLLLLDLCRRASWLSLVGCTWMVTSITSHRAIPGAGTGFKGGDCLGGMMVQIKWSGSTKIEHRLWSVTQTWNLSTTLVHRQVISCNIQFLNIPYFWCPAAIVWLDRIPFPVHFLVATDYLLTTLALPTIYGHIRRFLQPLEQTICTLKLIFYIHPLALQRIL